MRCTKCDKEAKPLVVVAVSMHFVTTIGKPGGGHDHRHTGQLAAEPAYKHEQWCLDCIWSEKGAHK